MRRTTPLSAEEEVRYQRQLLLPEVGESGQARLKACHVAVIGAGGLGATLLPLLVGAGVGQVTLCDGDSVSLSNLPRQLLYTPADIGQPKALLAAAYLQARHPHCSITAHAEYLDAENAERLLEGVDLILDATDRAEVRLLLDAYAEAHAVPWLYASVEGWQGQLALFLPGGKTYRELFPPEPSSPEPPSPVAVLPPSPAIVAALAADEALKYLLGLPTPLAEELLLLDALQLTVLHLRR